MCGYITSNISKITNKKIQTTKSTIKDIKTVYECYNLLPQPILITKKDIIIYANSEIYSILGIKHSKSVIGKSIFKLIYFIDSSDEDKYMKELKEYCKNRFNCKIKCNNNGFLNIYLNVNITTIDSVIYNFITIENKSKIQPPSTETDVGKELYKKLINISPDAICLHDGDNFCFSTDALVNMLKYNNQLDIIGKNIFDILPSEYHYSFAHKMEQVTSSDEILPESQYKFITKENNLIDVECKSARLFYNGKYLIITSIRDITEKNKLKELNLKAEENKKLLEKAIEYDRLKTEFFSNISHELRTPLNILLSSLQVLNLYLNKKPCDIKSSQKYTNIMKQNCFRLLRLINNLLDITKIDSGFYQLNLYNHDIVSIVEDITLSVADYLKDKKINIIFDTDIEEKIIACDEEKIERIILNLLSNSIKFTDANGTININIYDGKDSIKICVKDDGIGIPKEKLDTIFNRFIQVDKSLTRNNKGTGIGLALVKSLVELHNGKIYVQSEYGKGTEFTILLPNTIKNNCNLYDSSQKNCPQNGKIEKMDIEFSDIYF
ncbi:sensor histidine kinase ResE [Clostridium pasteurianum DSM 525 = ATCC 6013]|uniref:histidine kinase n=1 Tax=Clostridium pasteurianum DSM 525 = ATCC 6013 TaxID=1262449 RepID=A0A0H3J3E6_CLOPA|nr:PAS domain-containing sensor histidine kinase [Clostridium pasteurianum]AJA47342.1 sensor histidine kinase ResE [Clostridium pasteurianum DSM 525 = ATCC 6013]AJA51330.1 sensor histidine kinase ResE [Clostridium pasteurianum DSM 525 = ATCC 6013]AOZ74677.1 diguanylate cyclase [Clostridium pasteurianum DSM 525 = ATCC 6013]AOZ78474.1 diguanylate cyclase [Clostridium pasteurianum]KRU12663.1 PAS/PAC sensor signal transduction histidine kinase [Clostridium pasteurianum DSM 525 = ATCC 6013]